LRAEEEYRGRLSRYYGARGEHDEARREIERLEEEVREPPVGLTPPTSTRPPRRKRRFAKLTGTPRPTLRSWAGVGELEAELRELAGPKASVPVPGGLPDDAIVILTEPVRNPRCDR
jgi:hypothetical protein